MYKGTVSACFETKENSGIHHLVLSCKINQEVGPGQFIKLEPLAKGSEIYRPFSIYKITDDRIVVVFEVVGENTRVYSQLRSGDRIKIKGPLGKPIPIDAKAKRYILVGGGNGTSSLMFKSEELAKKSIETDVLLGFKNESKIFGVNDFKNNLFRLGQVKVITENGPKPNGFVTDLLEAELEQDNKESVIVACGPRQMLKKVAEMTAESGNECWVLLEEMMACGVGSCKSCVVFGFDENGKEEIKHVCTDGPAFDSRWINWEKLVPPETIITLPQSEKTDKPMKTMLGPFTLEYLIMNASGCLDIEAIENGIVDISRLGALVSKGIKLKPELGNPPPRIVETPYGLMNAIGLEGVGIDEFIKIYLPRWLSLGKPFIANISGTSIADFVKLTKRLTDNGVKIIEVNISCPNIQGQNIIFGTSPQMTFKIVQAVRKATTAILIVKLTPETPDIVAVAERAVEAGADAVSLINTLTGLVIDPKTLKSKIGNVTGGMSGPGVRPRAVKLVRDVYMANLGVPIIGMCGIEDGDSASQFIIAGASLIAVGTELLVNPNVATEIYDGLEEFRQFHGRNHIRDLIGSLVV